MTAEEQKVKPQDPKRKEDLLRIALAKLKLAARIEQEAIHALMEADSIN